MSESSQTVTMQGHPLPLKGAMPRVGDPAPDFSAVDNEMAPFHLSDMKGKVPEIAEEPDYDAVLQAVRELA